MKPIKKWPALIFLLFITCFFYCCNYVTNATHTSNKGDTILSADGLNKDSISHIRSSQDSADCLGMVCHIIRKQSNFWEEFKKNSKNELCSDIADSEADIYIDGVEGVEIDIRIVAGDEYIKRDSLTPNVNHTVSWLTLDLNKKELWAFFSVNDSVKLKFDTTLLPLIRKKCITE